MPTHGYTATREAAMVAFAKSWRRGIGRSLINANQAAPLYSITSSAGATNLSGIWRSSAFAVSRLMTSSYLVGCTTGRSVGLRSSGAAEKRDELAPLHAEHGDFLPCRLASSPAGLTLGLPHAQPAAERRLVLGAGSKFDGVRRAAPRARPRGRPQPPLLARSKPARHMSRGKVLWRLHCFRFPDCRRRGGASENDDGCQPAGTPQPSCEPAKRGATPRWARHQRPPPSFSA